ncbi:hypothetical protein FPQ18DRAFT_300994 [Pyronema domesticum]|uniref:Uncharacterized protein n=1 Tax=Pyronema omphalodes (strain CBS 100304) TaxID=1076935 RepID=U4L0A7_PYROM|nr:hypothetical protein FPQ18DRAFT_300994 [Pyronema domesticum]CCX07989.1 Protein of unknown function [Pyronema omphalodes CBS 100304]
MQLPTLVILAFSAIAIAAPAENKAQTPAQSTDTCYWMAAGNKEAKGNIIKGVIGCCWQGAVCKAVTPGQQCNPKWTTICCPKKGGVTLKGLKDGICRDKNFTRGF